jgi:hypothetical protein
MSFHKGASNWTENHHWYCRYILILFAYIPNLILLSIYICIISKVGIVCPNSFHLTYVSWNKERSNHFICPIRKALQTELKTITDFPTYFNFFPTIFFLIKFFLNLGVLPASKEEGVTKKMDLESWLERRNPAEWERTGLTEVKSHSTSYFWVSESGCAPPMLLSLPLVRTHARPRRAAAATADPAAGLQTHVLCIEA